MKELKRSTSTGTAAIWFGFFTLLSGHTAYSEEPIPMIVSITVSSSNVNLTVANIATGGTYYVEYTGDLTATNWTETSVFEGDPAITNWNGNISGASISAFYRLMRETYLPQVGESATFGEVGPLYHNVSGTAHIINNHTIELRNFNYDGGGIVVQVYLSPNTTFAPYVAISDNIKGTAFNDATLQLAIPEGTDLNTYTNISVWCVEAGISFGTGVF